MCAGEQARGQNLTHRSGYRETRMCVQKECSVQRCSSEIVFNSGLNRAYTMAMQSEVGVGDFVLMDKIDIDNFMKNLELRQVTDVFSSATTIRFKKRGVTGVRYCTTQVGTPLRTVT